MLHSPVLAQEAQYWLLSAQLPVGWVGLGVGAGVGLGVGRGVGRGVGLFVGAGVGVEPQGYNRFN